MALAPIRVVQHEANLIGLGFPDPCFADHFACGWKDKDEIEHAVGGRGDHEVEIIFRFGLVGVWWT